jgi:hypothetical protein
MIRKVRCRSNLDGAQLLHNRSRTGVFQAKNCLSSPLYIIESEQKAPGRFHLLNRLYELTPVARIIAELGLKTGTADRVQLKVRVSYAAC